MRQRIGVAFVIGVLLVAGVSRPAAAGPFTRLQVLLPGESAAPGTLSGKTGSPQAQVAGIPFSITVRACDAQWYTVTSVTDAVQILSSDQSATLPGVAQLASGSRTFTVTLNAGGSFTIFAHDQTDGTIPDGSSSPVSVSVLKGFTIAVPTRPNGRTVTQTAGGAFQITVNAVDANGNRVTGFSGAVNVKELTNFGDGLASPSQITLSAGTWTGAITVYRADLTVNRGANVYAWLPSNTSVDGTSPGFNVNPDAFARLQIVLPGQTPVPGSATGITGTPAAQVAGSAFTVGVYATDNWWNQVSSGDVVSISSSDPAATTASGSLNNGYQAFTITMRTVGTQTLSVRDVSRSTILGMTSAGFSVLPNSADHFVVSAIASPQTAGVPVAVTIRAVDQAGNTIPSYSGDAVLLANTGASSITPEQVTFASGVWSGNMVFRGAGASVQFTVSDFAAPPHTGGSNTFVVQPGPLAGVQVLLPGETAQGGTPAGKTGTPTGQSAGAPFTLTVRAVDAYWNRVSSTDSVGLGSTDAFAAMPAETVLVNGQALIPTRLYRSGAQRIWASDITQPTANPDTSSAVTVTGGPFARVLILAPGESPAPGTASGRTGTATDESINYAFTMTVLATDAWWNPVNGVTDLVHLTSTDPMATLPADSAMVDGRIDLPLRLATGGYQQISASDASRPSIGGSTTQVRAISTGFHLQAAVTPDSALAGQTFTLTVKVVNDAGSVIQEINSFVTVQVQNAGTRAAGRGTLLTSQFQLLQGQRTVSETYSFAEPIVLVVRDDAGNAPGITGPIDILPGAATAIQLASAPPWVGGDKHARITARVVDAYANGVPSQTVNFALVSGFGTLTPIDNLTDSTGVAAADFLSPRTPETDRIRAVSGPLSADVTVQTALVDPNAPGGTVTNYPNPFHPPSEATTIAYQLTDDSNVTLRIFTLSGDLVREESFAGGSTGGHAGLNAWNWDGRNGKGSAVASGGYLVLIEARGYEMRRKVAVVR
jgi:hypothetical protein